MYDGDCSIGLRGLFNGNINNPLIYLCDEAHTLETRNYSSPALTYLDSQGNQVDAPAGAITIAFSRSGIDAVNTTVMHEVEHLHVEVRWAQLPPGDWFLAYGSRTQDNGNGILDPGENDFDGDQVPNAVEDGMPGLRWDRASTDPQFYLDGPLGSDLELWCELPAQNAPAGNPGNDWAFEGKQSTPDN